MQILENLIQGSPEWLETRAAHFCASDAPAMMGYSKYKSRTELLDEKVSGIAKEVSAETQRLFDAGHASEEAMRPVIEAEISDELYRVTGTETVEGLPLLASYDGLTFDDQTAWENKMSNKELIAYVEQNQDLPDTHWPQVEHQLVVMGQGRVLFSCGDARLWYTSKPERRAAIIAGWKQFAKDMEAHTVTQHAEKPAAEVVIDLPALFIHAKGEITDSNMKQFGIELENRLAIVRSMELMTDQDFSNAEAMAKMFRDQCSKLKLKKEEMLAQTVSIGEAAKMIDAWGENLRVTALNLEKKVDAEKSAKQLAIVNAARAEYADHMAALEAEIKPIRLPLPQPDFAVAMKGKRKVSAWHDAVATALSQAKSAADVLATDYRAKLAWCKQHAEGKSALFPDLQQIIAKPLDDFTLLITSRIEAQQKAEAEKLEAERARIEAEAKAKAEAEAAAKLAEETARIRAEERAKAEAEAATAKAAQSAQEAAEAPKAIQPAAPSKKDSAKPVKELPSSRDVIEAIELRFVVSFGDACALILTAAESLHQSA